MLFNFSIIIILGIRMVVAMMMTTVMISMIAIIIIWNHWIIALLLLLLLSSWPLHVIIYITDIYIWLVHVFSFCLTIFTLFFIHMFEIN